MQVQDAMLPNPLTVSPDTSVLDFVDMILDSNQTTGVVLGDGDKLLGIVSVHDVFRKIVPHYLEMDDKLVDVIHEGYFEERFEKFKNMSVREIMTTNVSCIQATDALIKAVAHFVRKLHKTIPVLKDGKFIGTITRRSILRRVTRHP